MNTLDHPQLKTWSLLGEVLFAAGEEAARRAARLRRDKKGNTRRPGRETPLWNTLRDELKKELTRRGAKARLARYLGIPRQRLNDYLRGGSRIPDAEITLRLLHWFLELSGGRDLTR